MIKQNQNGIVPEVREKSKESHYKKPQNSAIVKNGAPLTENTKTYGELLAQRLRTSEKVTTHPMLRSGNWTKNSYEILAMLIKEDLNGRLSMQQRIRLGTSLSSRTLRKIALAEYKITRPTDPRILNTLNKVVIFLGYNNWHHFISTAVISEQAAEKEKDPGQTVIEVVKAAVHNEYLTYYNLPEKAEDLLVSTHIENSPSFNFIMDITTEKKEKKLVISNRFNPSTCEILDIAVKKLEAAYAQVCTREYWHLCWWDIHKKHYVQRYKNISDHIYILNKANNGWKVKTNVSTADPMKVK